MEEATGWINGLSHGDMNDCMVGVNRHLPHLKRQFHIILKPFIPNNIHIYDNILPLVPKKNEYFLKY